MCQRFSSLAINDAKKRLKRRCDWRLDYIAQNGRTESPFLIEKSFENAIQKRGPFVQDSIFPQISRNSVNRDVKITEVCHPFKTTPKGV